MNHDRKQKCFYLRINMADHSLYYRFISSLHTMYSSAHHIPKQTNIKKCIPPKFFIQNKLKKVVVLYLPCISDIMCIMDKLSISGTYFLFLSYFHIKCINAVSHLYFCSYNMYFYLCCIQTAF